MSTEASRIIDEIGGTSVVARMCEVTDGAVSQWRTNGIPKGWQKYLRAEFPEAFGISKGARRFRKKDTPTTQSPRRPLTKSGRGAGSSASQTVASELSVDPAMNVERARAAGTKTAIELVAS